MRSNSKLPFCVTGDIVSSVKFALLSRCMGVLGSGMLLDGGIVRPVGGIARGCALLLATAAIAIVCGVEWVTRAMYEKM